MNNQLDIKQWCATNLYKLVDEYKVIEKIVVAINEDDVFKQAEQNRINNYILILGNQLIESDVAPIGYNKFENTIDFYLFCNTKSLSADYLKVQELEYYIKQIILEQYADKTEIFYHWKLNSIEPGNTIESNSTKQLRYYLLQYKFWTMIDRNYNPLA